MGDQLLVDLIYNEPVWIFFRNLIFAFQNQKVIYKFYINNQIFEKEAGLSEPYSSQEYNHISKYSYRTMVKHNKTVLVLRKNI